MSFDGLRKVSSRAVSACAWVISKWSLILRLARDLTVVARVIASECDDEDVQARERCDAFGARSVLQREKIESDARPLVEQEVQVAT